MNYIKKFEAKKELNYKRFDIDGYVVYQGKNAEGNDYITLEIANENDIWMHSKGIPGSHIVIKVGDKLPSEEVIRKAAILAAKNCKSKESEIKVVYCKKKFVKKEPGLNVGQVRVDYINSNEIIVNKK